VATAKIDSVAEVAKERALAHWAQTGKSEGNFNDTYVDDCVPFACYTQRGVAWRHLPVVLATFGRSLLAVRGTMKRRDMELAPLQHLTSPARRTPHNRGLLAG
jgi:hypothetical protein